MPASCQDSGSPTVGPALPSLHGQDGTWELGLGLGLYEAFDRDSGFGMGFNQVIQL